MDELQNITLISFGRFERNFLEKTASAVKQEFLMPVAILEGRLDLSDYYEPGRRQYDGTRLLKAVDALSTTGSVKTLGLF
ncbi:MAG: hypothetical protein MUC31_02715, partial [Bacteroidales bacterium]|nr:hypothetical protein [Bacteroidales bacterium]